MSTRTGRTFRGKLTDDQRDEMLFLTMEQLDAMNVRLNKMDTQRIQPADDQIGNTKKCRGRPKTDNRGATRMKGDEQSTANFLTKQKRNTFEHAEESSVKRKMPKCVAACLDFKEKSFHFTGTVAEQKVQVVENETNAIRLTSGPDNPRSNRRLTDFIFHDLNGVPKSFQMSEINDLFISGVVLSLEPSADKKEKGVRCKEFGRIEEWAISGYDEGLPVVWISTAFADYDCVKPATSYKKFYDLFFEKARASIEVYKLLAKLSGAKFDMSLDELLAGVARSMSGTGIFVGGISAMDFVLSQGEFIYDQLRGLEQTSNNCQAFADIPVLVSLSDESRKRADSNIPAKVLSDGRLKIEDGNELDQSCQSSSVEESGENEKRARLMKEEDLWNSMKQKKNKRQTSSAKKLYSKINEHEIAADYPLPAYYKISIQETDEYLVFDSDIKICDSEDLPRSMLHNWALYDSDSRLVSLELLPMRLCDEIDITIFGSGTMATDDGSGFFLHDGPNQCSSGASEKHDTQGISVFLSAIKEWVVEFGASMVFISIRTDMAWYRLGKPSKQYDPWQKPALKTTKLAISIITLLKDQT